MTTLHQYRRMRRGRRRAPSNHRPFILALVVPVALVLVAVGAGFAAGATNYYHDVTSGVLPAPEAVDARGGGAKIYDRNGTLLYEYLDENYGYHTSVPLGQISPLIQNATIAAEDASFYSNPGINVKGSTRAAIENLKPGDEFLQGTGGSSITQQLVKQLYFTPQERQERSLSRKMREAVARTRDDAGLFEAADPRVVPERDALRRTATPASRRRRRGTSASTRRT